MKVNWPGKICLLPSKFEVNKIFIKFVLGAQFEMKFRRGRLVEALEIRRVVLLAAAERIGVLSTEFQEEIIGRTKINKVELDDIEDTEQRAYKQLATIKDLSFISPFILPLVLI